MTESLDTSTAMGRFVMDIIQRIAQLESEQIGERVYIGMEQKAKTGKGMLGFNIPYGYDYIDGKLVVNKKEAEVVRNIFKWYIEGKSIGEIVDILRRENVPTKRGRVWAKKTVSSILKNPVYCGYLRWERYLNKGDHKPIIDVETYNRVQELIKKRGGKPGIKISN